MKDNRFYEKGKHILSVSYVGYCYYYFLSYVILLFPAVDGSNNIHNNLLPVYVPFVRRMFLHMVSPTVKAGQFVVSNIMFLTVYPGKNKYLFLILVLSKCKGEFIIVP